MTRRLLAAAGILLLLIGCARRPTVWVFTAPWDPRSDSAAVSGITGRATLVSGWIALDTADAPPVALFVDPVPIDGRRRPPRFALLTSYRGDRFHPEIVRRLGDDPAALARTTDAVAQLVHRGAYRGVVLDFEALEPRDTLALRRVAGALAAAARRGGATRVAIAVPALDTLAYAPRHLLPVVDDLLVMLYDQHWMGGTPGPVAAVGWARDALAQWVTLAGASRVVAALPTYGYHWQVGASTDVVGWADVERLSAAWGIRPVRDSASGALRLTADGRGDVWLADGPQMVQFLQDVRALRVRTVALWRLGLEDPAVWTALGAR